MGRKAVRENDRESGATCTPLSAPPLAAPTLGSKGTSPLSGGHRGQEQGQN